MTTRSAKRRGRTAKTPIRDALRKDSPLQSLVQNGLGAVKDAHRRYFEEQIRSTFADSLDADQGLQVGHEQENRWDYLLGHAPTKQLVGVEPHSAESGEIGTVIKKLESARKQLQDHLRDGMHISRWLWVASGEVQFSPMEKAIFRLAQSGITFVGRKVMSKHLPRA